MEGVHIQPEIRKWQLYYYHCDHLRELMQETGGSQGRRPSPISPHGGDADAVPLWKEAIPRVSPRWPSQCPLFLFDQTCVLVGSMQTHRYDCRWQNNGHSKDAYILIPSSIDMPPHRAKGNKGCRWH
jgi:hypothetical protein